MNNLCSNTPLSNAHRPNINTIQCTQIRTTSYWSSSPWSTVNESVLQVILYEIQVYSQSWRGTWSCVLIFVSNISCVQWIDSKGKDWVVWYECKVNCNLGGVIQCTRSVKCKRRMDINVRWMFDNLLSFDKIFIYLTNSNT